MVLALITLFGREFELVLRPKGPFGLSSATPVTIETTGSPVEETPGLAKCGSNVVQLRRTGT